MKTILLIAMFLLMGCTTEDSCDEYFERMFPGQEYDITTIGSTTRLYRLKQSNRYFACYVGTSSEYLQTLEWTPAERGTN